MPEHWYQGFIITASKEPTTGSAAVERLEVSKDGAVLFAVLSRADYSTSALLQQPAESLAAGHGRYFVHGLVDLDRFEYGVVYETNVASGSPAGKISDEDLETEILHALRRMARVALSTSLIPHFDVGGIATVLEVDRRQVSEVLGEMALTGWVEGFAETLAAGLTEGHCRLTSLGLAEAKRRASRGHSQMTDKTSNHGKANPMYDVSVSFAGEDRDYVETTVRAMEGLGLKLFYDLDHQAELFGRDLVEELHRVYARQSRRVLMFVSNAYVEKPMPTHERRSALSKAVNEPNAPYVLQVKLADVEVPGIPTTQVWADGRTMSPEEIAALVRDHLQADSGNPVPALRPHTAGLKRIDQELYEDLIELLPSAGVIQVLDVRGLPPSWEPELLKPLKEFWHNWDNAEHEFQDPMIETLRKDLLTAVNELLSYVALNTFRLDDGNQGIPPEWEDTQRKRAIEVDRQLVEKGNAVVAAHQGLIREVRTRL